MLLKIHSHYPVERDEKDYYVFQCKDTIKKNTTCITGSLLIIQIIFGNLNQNSIISIKKIHL